MNTADLMLRVDKLIQLAIETVEALRSVAVNDVELLHQFRTGGLSFLRDVFGSDHTFSQGFANAIYKPDSDTTSTRRARGILEAAREEIDKGWIFNFKGLISADIFKDFFAMAEYLLEKGYKDAAAVMLGGTLEEHLRLLCAKYSISTTQANNNGVVKNKMAEQMNAELYSANIYNLTDSKQITAWLDIRNKSAHAEYTAYNKAQVEGMNEGVIEFVSRVV